MPLSRPLWTLYNTIRPEFLFPKQGLSSTLCLRCRQLYSTSKSASSSRPGAPRPESDSPVDDYYALLLSQPLPVSGTTSNPTSSPIQPSSSSSTGNSPTQASPLQEGSPVSKARVIFGSRLAGPAARAAREGSYADMQARGEGEWIAGSWIPPRPSEPDNCCMSGCVNCVWDGYREELEGWAERRKEARLLEMKQKQGEASGSMDDDGGGSESLWRKGDQGLLERGEFGSEGLFEGVPVGIREFMRTEKRLGERKKKATQRSLG